MNYNFISQILDNGLSEEELIASLSKSLPHLAKKARKMFFGGYSPKDIVNLFSQDKDAQKVARKGLKPVTPSEIAAMHLQNSYNNIPQSAENQTKESLQSFTKQAAPYALSAVATPFVAPMAEAALSRALPKMGGMAKDIIQKSVGTTMQQMGQGSGQSQQAQGLETGLPQTTSQPPVEEANIPQQQTLPQPEIKTIDPVEVLNNSNALSKVNDLLSTKNDPDSVGAYFRKFDPKTVKQVEKEAGKTFEEVISEYKQKQPPPEEMGKAVKEPPPEPPTAPESIIKPAKGSIVETPDGIGEVREIRNGKALVEVDGKMRKMLEEELLGPSKEIQDIDFDQLAKDYVESIPEVDRSTAMLMNFFQPTSEDGQTGQFFVMFPSDPEHIGVYKNVSKELADQINSAKNIPKTTKKTILGEHVAGRPDSRYAAATDLRKHPELYPYEKLPIPYHLASKLFKTLNELDKQERAEESRRKKEAKALQKKSKDENKKRKKQTA